MAAAVLTGVAGVGLTLALTTAIADLARDVTDAARARTAADAAALAGVAGGPAASTRYAAANDAVLVSWARTGDDVVVEVRVGDAVAAARATGGDVTPPP